MTDSVFIANLCQLELCLLCLMILLSLQIAVYLLYCRQAKGAERKKHATLCHQACCKQTYRYRQASIGKNRAQVKHD